VGSVANSSYNEYTKSNLKIYQIKVLCKRRSSVNSGAWLWRFDDVTGVEKSCVVKGINRKKQRKIFCYYK